MKIYSKYSDYYDSILGYGVDDNQRFIRKTTEEKLNDTNELIQSLIYKDRIDTRVYHKDDIRRYMFYCDTGFQYFCGKIYPFLRIDTFSINTPKHYIFDIEHLEKFLESYDYKVSGYESGKTGASNFYGKRLTRKNVIDYFDHYHGISDNGFLIKLNEKFDFQISHCKVTNNRKDFYMVLNNNLKDIGFQTIFDPFSANQEISMFLFGIVGNKEIIGTDIPDNVMRDAKGFDKMSFKKYPTKNIKRNRKK